MNQKLKLLLFFIGLASPFIVPAQKLQSLDLVDFKTDQWHWRRTHNGSQAVAQIGKHHVRILYDSSDFDTRSGELIIMSPGFIGRSKFGPRPHNSEQYMSLNTYYLPLLYREEYALERAITQFGCGYLNGDFEVVNSKGDTIALYHYNVGMRTGLCFDNDLQTLKPIRRAHFVDNRYHGLCQEFNPETGWKTETWFDMGKTVIEKGFDSLIRLRRFEVPHKNRTIYYPNGKIHILRQWNGSQTQHMRYDSNGILRVQGQFNYFYSYDSVGTWSWYDRSGKLERQKLIELALEPEEVEETNEVFEMFCVVATPRFPGGKSKLEELIFKELKPRNKESGKVVVAFTVFKDGRVGEIVLVSSEQQLTRKTHEALLQAVKHTSGMYQPMAWRDKYINARMEMVLVF